jgi:SAM-dependent methyltransferase
MLSVASSGASAEPRENVVCPLCGGGSEELFMIARDRLFGQPGEYPMVRCTKCDLRFLASRPSLDALGVHYPLAYFPYKKIEDEHPLLRPFTRRFENTHWQRMLERIERGTGRFTQTSEVLDIGCGNNHLLERVKEIRGCVGTGVEFNPDVAAYVRDVRKMPVVAGTLHDAKFPDARFDVVTMNGYLEHEPFPRAVLEETRRVTKEGGFVSITVPQADSLPARMFGSCWAQVDAPRHLFHFTPASIDKLLAATGFELVRIESFAVPFAIGLSVLQSLGRRHMGALGLVDSLLAPLFALPFMPLSRWFGEFMCVTGRAVAR